MGRHDVKSSRPSTNSAQIPAIRPDGSQPLERLRGAAASVWRSFGVTGSLRKGGEIFVMSIANLPDHSRGCRRGDTGARAANPARNHARLHSAAPRPPHTGNRWVQIAHAGQIGGHCPLIQLDGGDCGQFHGACSRWTIPGSVTAVVRAFGSGRPSSVRRKRLCVARRIWVKSAPPAPRLAMTIASQPGAVGQFRTASRMRRLVWFRTTALPTRLPATMQKRLRSMPLGQQAHHQ